MSLQPRAFSAFDPQTKNVARAVGQHAQGQIHRLAANHGLFPDLHAQGIEEDHRIHQFQRPNLPLDPFPAQHALGGQVVEVSETRLYLLCYAWLRYRQFTDNLVDALAYHMKQLEDETSAAAKKSFDAEHLRRQQETPQVRAWRQRRLQPRTRNSISDYE